MLSETESEKSEKIRNRNVLQLYFTITTIINNFLIMHLENSMLDKKCDVTCSITVKRIIFLTK